MSKYKKEIEITAANEAEAEAILKAVGALAEKLSAKELTRLRQIVLFEPTVLAAARRALQL
jgi:hypothetical protein